MVGMKVIGDRLVCCRSKQPRPQARVPSKPAMDGLLLAGERFRFLFMTLLGIRQCKSEPRTWPFDLVQTAEYSQRISGIILTLTRLSMASGRSTITSMKMEMC